MDDFNRISELTVNIDAAMTDAINDFNFIAKKYLDFLAGKEPARIADRNYEQELQKMYDDAREKVYELAKTGLFSYSNAIYLLKMGKNVTRKFWFWAGTKVFLRMITPSGTSENTEPYTQMVKRIYDKEGVHLRTKLFPCVISDESIYSDDWCVVEFEYNEIVK